MLKKTIAYTDYNGVERKEDFYFNLSKAELLEMEMSINGGISTLLEKIVKEQDGKKMLEHFKEIILKAYGEKSLDGKRFVKSKEIAESFMQTEAYSNLFMEITQDGDKAAEFVNAIVPQIKNK